jgi:hypothetical protein
MNKIMAMPVARQPGKPAGSSAAYQPVRLKNDLASYAHKEQQQDDAAATASTTTAPKAHVVLQPVENDVEQKEFEKPFQASVTTIHDVLAETQKSFDRQSTFWKSGKTSSLYNG